MIAKQIRHALGLLTNPDNTVSSVARMLGVSRATIDKYVPELPRIRPAAALPAGRSNGRSPTGAGRAGGWPEDAF